MMGAMVTQVFPAIPSFDLINSKESNQVMRQSTMQAATNGESERSCKPTTDAILIGSHGNSRCSKQQGKQPNKDHPTMHQGINKIVGYHAIWF
jgi:hypothetical protein